MSLIPAFKIGWWNAWIFMSVFILQMLAIMFADKRIRQKSHVPMHLRQNNLERVAGIIGNVIWMLGMGYSVFLPLQIGTIWFYAGLPVFILGLTFMTFATYTFITTSVDQVITKGVYRFSRHPMYLATFLIFLGSGIAAGSWVFLFFSVISFLCFHQEALIEERYCLDKYGSGYQEYMKHVPRWIGII